MRFETLRQFVSTIAVNIWYGRSAPPAGPRAFQIRSSLAPALVWTGLLCWARHLYLVENGDQTKHLLLRVAASSAVVSIGWLGLKVRNQNGYTVLAELGDFMSSWASRKTEPVWDPDCFVWSKDLRKHYKEIKGEFEAYANTIPQYDDIDSVQHILNRDKKWKTLWLRLFGRDTIITKHFPTTMRLLGPTGCSSAMFSILLPGKDIPIHRGVYKGVLRYHLGLEVVQGQGFVGLSIHHEDKGAVVDGETKRPHTVSTLEWTEGGDVLFDDAFYHSVRNDSPHRRVVLFLDIPRPDLPYPVWLLNVSLLKILAVVSITGQNFIDKCNSYHSASGTTTTTDQTKDQTDH